MIRWRDFWVAAGATVAVNLLFEVAPQGGLLSMGVAAMVMAINVIGRERLPDWYRLFAVGCVISFGAGIGLVGRTMDVRVSRETLITASGLVVLFAGLPLLSLCFVWPGKRGVALAVCGFPICLAGALLIAEVEEWVFVKMNPSGAEHTARWTVSNHWMAYEPGGMGLYGSD